MKLVDALQLSSLRQAKIVAGNEGLHKEIRLVNVVDLPNPIPWVNTGDILLTTGFAWPKEDAEQRTLIYELADKGIAAVGMAVPHFFDEFSLAARTAADERQLPLMEIPWEVPFHSISEDVLNSIVMFHYDQKEQSEYIHRELMRIAVEAKSLQDIAVTLGKLVNKNLIIQHLDGPILASYGIHNGTQASYGIATDSDHLSQLLSTIQIEPQVKATLKKRSQPLQCSVDVKQNLPVRYAFPVHLEQELIGLIWVFSESLTDLEIHSIQYAAIVLALYISQERALASLEAQLGYSFLDALFEGKIQTNSQALRRAELLGYDPEETYSVGMVVLDVPIPMSREGIVRRERVSEQLNRRLKGLNISGILSVMQNQIFFLLPAKIQPELFWNSFHAQDISFAISIPYKGFENIQRGYREVCSIFQHLKFGQMHHYKNLLVPRVLMGDEEARALFLSRLFSPILKNRNSKMLMDTLLAFIEQGFHLKNTADHLKIHPKSLRYRLNRIMEIGDLNFENPETQFHLQLAARIRSL